MNNTEIRAAKRALVKSYREEGISLMSHHVLTEYRDTVFVGFMVMCSHHDCWNEAEFLGLFQVENPSERKPEGVQVKRTLCRQHSFTSSAWGVWPFTK